MNWDPHTLMDCLDSQVLAYLTAVLAFGMLVWYLAIAMRWYESIRYASESGRAVWGWLVAIFVVCALAGYVALILALVVPKFSVVFRIVFLALQNICCPFFWITARRYKFHLQGVSENIGESLLSKNLDDMADREVASLTRSLVIEGLRRRTDAG